MKRSVGIFVIYYCKQDVCVPNVEEVSDVCRFAASDVTAVAVMMLLALLAAM